MVAEWFPHSKKAVGSIAEPDDRPICRFSPDALVSPSAINVESIVAAHPAAAAVM